jgi:hypothetical protein
VRNATRREALWEYLEYEQIQNTELILQNVPISRLGPEPGLRLELSFAERQRVQCGRPGNVARHRLGNANGKPRPCSTQELPGPALFLGYVLLFVCAFLRPHTPEQS